MAAALHFMFLINHDQLLGRFGRAVSPSELYILLNGPELWVSLRKISKCELGNPG